MYRAGMAMHLLVDTEGRYYNKKLKRIVLREDDPDEIYRGQYYIRRYDGESLSLEYLNFYAEGAPGNTIALVAGIYGQRRNADSMLRVARGYVPGAFVVKAKLYMGCMH
jgi:hypothetical protein